MDVLFGTFGAPHATVGSCYTNYDPSAYLNTVADVGNAITFQGDGFRFDLGRRPAMYAKNNSERLFPYYSEIGVVQSQPL